MAKQRSWTNTWINAFSSLSTTIKTTDQNSCQWWTSRRWLSLIVVLKCHHLSSLTAISQGHPLTGTHRKRQTSMRGWVTTKQSRQPREWRKLGIKERSLWSEPRKRWLKISKAKESLLTLMWVTRSEYSPRTERHSVSVKNLITKWPAPSSFLLAKAIPIELNSQTS